MGLTLIRKGSRTPPKDPTIALVLAGGAMSGGAFKVGGLKALDDYLVGRRISDLDLYVGLSAGAILAVPLAAGISPDEMVKVLEGTSRRFDQLTPGHLYAPNFREMAERPASFLYELMMYAPGVLWDLLRDAPDLPRVLGPSLGAFVSRPSYAAAEDVLMAIANHVTPSREMPSVINHIPSGVFENSGLERWLRHNLEGIRMPNDFAAFEAKRGKRLYLAACALDTAERVIFGTDEKSDVTISQAVQASAALPLFYRPATIDGVDYIDGGIRNTANIDVAIEKGADLVICYNPFRPFHNRSEGDGDDKTFVAGHTLAERGMKMVLNQVFRTLLHSRLRIALQRYAADRGFEGDIVLLEPREDDADFFAINPIAFWKRADAIRHGFHSVRETVERDFPSVSAVLGRYGLKLDRKLAKRRAARLRLRSGWRITEAEAEVEAEAEAEARLQAVRAAG